jgi:spermidine synthase
VAYPPDPEPDEPLSGPPPEETVVYTVRSRFHPIHVTEIGFRRILRFEHNRQSSMYLDDPYETDIEYPAYFHLALAVQPKAAHTLAIGLGGGTVVKRMWRDYPDMSIDAVEIDPEVIDVARRFFALPDDPRIRVMADDGRHFVETTTERYDIVIVDAFEEDHVPVQIATEQFLRAARDRLRAGGAIVYNFIGSLAGDESRPFRSLYRTLANTWSRVWVFRVDEGVDAVGSNLILLATDADVSDEQLLARIADRVGGRVTLPAFHMFGRDLIRSGIRTGDVPILTDPPGRA